MEFKTFDGRTCLKIISDGTNLGTHVYAPDGSEIKNIKNIKWIASAGFDLPNCQIELVCQPMELHAQSMEYKEIINNDDSINKLKIEDEL